MNLIDTHCHLTHERLFPALAAALERARQAGVVAMICAAGDLEESRAALELARKHADIYCLAGVHPHEAKDAPADYLRQLEGLAADPRNVAIGEIGLDYHYNFSPPDVQRRVFAEQLALAGRLGKRIVIHSREAFDDTMAILKDARADGTSVAFHSCTEEETNVRRMLDLGAMVSFSGIVTFKKADPGRRAAAIVPDDRLLIETDSPYLSPEPVRKIYPNEPAFVAHVAACLATVRGISAAQLADLTTANARRFFGLM